MTCHFLDMVEGPIGQRLGYSVGMGWIARSERMWHPAAIVDRKVKTESPLGSDLWRWGTRMGHGFSRAKI